MKSSLGAIVSCWLFLASALGSVEIGLHESLTRIGAQFGVTYSVESVINPDKGGGSWLSERSAGSIDLVSLESAHRSLESCFPAYVVLPSPAVERHFCIIDRRLALNGPAGVALTYDAGVVQFSDCRKQMKERAAIVGEKFLAINAPDVNEMELAVTIPIQPGHAVRDLLAYAFVKRALRPVVWSMGVFVTPTGRPDTAKPSLLVLGSISMKGPADP